MDEKKITLDEAGALLDKYTDATPTPKPTSKAKKVKKAKEAIKRSHNTAANRQLGVLEEEGY